MNAIYLNNLPSKLRPISMARLAKTYKYPIVALLTERTSFKTDEVMLHLNAHPTSIPLFSGLRGGIHFYQCLSL